MPQWTCCTLFSGSSGNAIYVSAGRTRLLIDAGMPAARIESALRAAGAEAEQLDAILVTHEHSDHIKGVGPLARRHRIPVYTNAGTWSAMSAAVGSTAKLDVRIFESGSVFEVGDVAVRSFRTPHDAAESVGYVLDTGKGRVSVCTDLGEMTPAVMAAIRGSDVVFLESNYDDHMLMAGPYPWPLKKRIRGVRGHLSNDMTAAAACELLSTGTAHIVLSHLSRHNNFPELAEMTVLAELKEKGAEVGRDLLLSVAPPAEPGRRIACQDAGSWV